MKTIFNSWEADIEKCIEKCKNSPFTLKNSDYIVLFHCHNAEHQHVTAHLGARSHELHRLYFLRWQARAHSVTVRPSKNHAQLTEMQRILWAVSDRMVNCSAFRFQNANSSTAAAAGTVSVLYCASRAALLRRTALCPAATPDEHALKSCRSGNGSASISSVPYCHKLINIRLFGLGDVTVKRRRLI